jgi:alpha-mannosidase
VRLDNTARDHRLRLLFPTGKPVSSFLAATTFDVARRQPGRRESKSWVHPAPFTFPQQGFVSANGLTVAAPDLPEAEVTAGGTIALTLLRAVGWLSRLDLKTRPQMAGPAIPTPGAQCLGSFETRIALLPGLDFRAVRDAELGLWAVAAGEEPLVEEGRALVAVHPPEVLLSALKPCERGAGFVLRVLNPSARLETARVRFGFPVRSVQAVRLDETPVDLPVSSRENEIVFDVPAHALRSIQVEAHQ